ncbi:MAG: inositol monophosphatase [Actinomycetota bacterium]|nr:inositol monophosphatase [Actinomycetota bacterium]
MFPVDSDALLALATDLAREAGALALRMRHSAAVVDAKSSPTDVVTAADRAVEGMLVDALHVARPEDGVLGEEGGSAESASGLRWVVDPIDGTVNYLYGIPHWAVSLGVEDDKGACVGVVYDPSKDELWQAVRGAGATLNGAAISCSAVKELGQALVGTGFGYDARRRAAQAVALPDLLPRVRDIRRLGAGSLDLCSVASGRLDAYYEQGLSPWDLSAGGLIAREAGALVTGLRGADPGYALVLAAAPGVHQVMHDLLVGYDADADPLSP